MEKQPKKRIMNTSTVKKRLEELELIGVKDIAVLLNWSQAKVATYVNRGYLPEEVGKISGRPVWYKPDIIKTALAAKPTPWKIYEENDDYVDEIKEREKERKKLEAEEIEALKKEQVGA